MKIQLSANLNHKNKMPQFDNRDEARRWWATFNGGFQSVTVTPSEFAGLVQSGFATCALMSGFRKKENFVAGQHFGLDFDDGSMSLEQLANHPIVKNNAGFVHTTPSHTDQHPKLRAVFILDRPITSAEKYTLLVESCVWLFSHSDKSCKDPARLFFGAEGCQVVNLDNVITLETCAKIAVKDYKKHLAEQAKQKQVDFVPAEKHQLHAAFLVGKMRHLCDHIRNAPNGEKWLTLRRISYTVGGLVSGGYYDYHYAETQLQNAIGHRGADVGDMKHAHDTITLALKAGLNDPIQIPLDEITANPQAQNSLQTLATLENRIREFDHKTGDPVVYRQILAQYNQVAYHVAK